MNNLNSSYWDTLYQNKQTGWDIGYASPPIMEYFKQVDNKDLKILIPGAGNAWEAEELWKDGFTQVHILDFSLEAVSAFKRRVPDFPKSQIIIVDFFQHQADYDIIVEQTFFSSLPVDLRESYAKQMHRLLKPEGKLIGLLFNHPFNFKGPPFGGTPDEYKELFKEYFQFCAFDIAQNSIKPRQKREHFILLQKK